VDDEFAAKGFGRGGGTSEGHREQTQTEHH
jgi:hypothetical protein